MDHISIKLIKSLKTLGLSEYEARIYSALVMHDHAEAKELVEFLGISKPSVYESLQSLEDMGLVVIANSKPATYKAVSPDMAIKLLMDVHEIAAMESLETLKALEKEKIDNTEADSLWSIYGKANIEYKVEEMLRNATKTVYCVMSGRYLPQVERLAGKGLSFDLIILSDEPGITKRVESTFKNDRLKLAILSLSSIKKSEWLEPDLLQMVADMNLDNLLELLVDDREFLSIPPIGNTLSGLYTTNRSLITFMKLDDQFLWEGIKSLIKPPKAGKVKRKAHV
jgi:sugar-specific transcriptional regulator TrmB